ncbi:MAG TPA: hypothetical protein VIL85_06210 [Thermomicrobiales bacterium]|jgi:hypothetical protein
MSDQGAQRPADVPADQDAPTPQQEDEALQQAMRREAATREELPDADQVSDSANRGTMGAQGSAMGRRSGR